MIRTIVDIAIMPKETEIAVVEPYLVYQPFAEEICLVLREVHVIRLAQGVVHHDQRMERERRQTHGLRVDPSHSPRGLEAETCLIRKSHREIVGVAGIRQTLHPVNIATQVVRTEHLAIFNRWNGAIVAAMHTNIDVIMPEHMFEALEIPSVQVVLRVVITLAGCAFDEIDRFGFLDFGILL